MRSKICKAKRKDNKEWVEGFYFCMVHDDKRHEHHFIIPIGADLSKGTPIEKIQVEIDIETLCDDTGLTDKNGRKIWENDIVRHYNVPWEPARFTKGVVFWNGENLRYERSSEYTPNRPTTVNSSCIYEVIGNLFDNPEPLEKAR